MSSSFDRFGPPLPQNVQPTWNVSGTSSTILRVIRHIRAVRAGLGGDALFNRTSSSW